MPTTNTWLEPTFDAGSVRDLKASATTDLGQLGKGVAYLRYRIPA